MNITSDLPPLICGPDFKDIVLLIVLGILTSPISNVLQGVSVELNRIILSRSPIPRPNFVLSLERPSPMPSLPSTLAPSSSHETDAVKALSPHLGHSHGQKPSLRKPRIHLWLSPSSTRSEFGVEKPTHAQKNHRSGLGIRHICTKFPCNARRTSILATQLRERFTRVTLNAWLKFLCEQPDI
jgi:hypothetical protein